MHEFWHDYVKPKYGENAKLCYMNTDRFIVHVKTNDIHKDIAEDIETRSLRKEKNKKIIGLLKTALDGQT